MNKITNNINNKVYIGQTIDSLEKRFYKHCWEAQHSNDRTSPLHQAMRKYGIQNFTIVVIEECENSNLNNREKYWIKQYNTFLGDGYNATLGGEGNAKLDEEEVLSLWWSGKNQKEIAEILSCDRHTVSRCLSSNNIPYEERQKNKYGNKAKTVLQINLEGEIVAEYDSATIAAKETNSSLPGISLVCNGKRKTHNGYVWKYKENNKIT